MATLQPRPGFDWMCVNWGGPDEPRTDRCSYCGDPFPEDDEADFIPLIMWNDAGFCAEFCDHCQAAWFGVQTFPEPADEPDDDLPDLGPCCMCEGTEGVRNIIMLGRPLRCPGTAGAASRAGCRWTAQALCCAIPASNATRPTSRL